MAKGKQTIYVSGTNPQKIEGKAVAATAPGTIVENVAGGLQINAAAATVFGQELLVADIDTSRSRPVTTSWTIAENMVAIKAVSGDFLNVLVATGQTISSRGTPLSLNGAGLLKIAVTPATVGATSEQVLAYSDEIITTSGTTLVRVRVA